MLNPFYRWLHAPVNETLNKPIEKVAEEKINWSRVVMVEATQTLVKALPYSEFRALEISGTHWEDFGFMSYESANFPMFDVCKGSLPRTFNIILADQVLEHVLWPYRAGKNIYEMLEPGGYFLVTTPFLVKIHNDPTDCTRWTEVGLKYFLAECGFPLDGTKTGSWGNRECVIENFSRWIPYRPGVHSLKNDTDFPYHVWALARKPLSESS